MTEGRRLRLGVALGGGSARGWAHMGVLQWLTERGLEPDVVCGTSIGALVGAAQGAGQLPRLQEWVLSLSWQDVVGYLDVSFDGGLIRGRKLFDFFQRHFPAPPIEDLSCTYGAVATDLTSGREIWLRHGPLLEAVRASVALPGLFTPVQYQGRWLVDGGLVNPVPVSVCRALGADVVVAVDVNSDLLERREIKPASGEAAEPAPHEHPLDAQIGHAAGGWHRWLGGRARRLKRRLFEDTEEGPSLLDVMARSVHIMQVRITRSRMAGDPPEVLLSPRLGNIGLLEFHRGGEALDAGRRCAEDAAETIERVLKR